MREARRAGRLLFVPGANPAASFVAADRHTLAGLVPSRIELAPGTGVSARLNFARRLRQALSEGDVRLIVLWFAAPGYAPIVAWQSRVRGVPLLVMAGGAEVANCPELGFGDARRWWRRLLVSRVLNGAAAVWAFSEAAAVEIAAVAGGARIAIVPPTVDTPFFTPSTAGRERLILTACARITRPTARQKGLDRLVAAARVRPDLSFAILGALDGDVWVRAFAASAPPNVTFLGEVDRTSLRAWFARAHVYAQLSGHEGFGVAVAEASAMGCVPVVTDLPALRAIVGSDGVIVARDATDEQVCEALDCALGRSANPAQWQSIDSRFGPGVRRRAWVRELEKWGVTDRGEDAT